MPVQSRQERLRTGGHVTDAEMQAVRELNAGQRIGRRRARERAPDAYNYGDGGDAELDDRIAELEAYKRRAIEKQRPYYAIDGSTRTADLEARLADANNPPTEAERQNILGMLAVNKRYRWWKRRHPDQ